MDYPLFRDPAQYLRRRDGRFLLKKKLKRWFEYRALNSLLQKTEEVHTVCDVPSGPGRLFEFWKSRGWEVTGLDFSDDMVEASTREHQALGLEGRVGKGDAFDLPEQARADLVACVRFVYYFDSMDRVRLLRSLATSANRYVLAQFKSSETSKGRKNMTRAGQRDDAYRKYHCSHDQMRQEVEAAGMKFLGFAPIYQSSDRVYALAEVAQG